MNKFQQFGKWLISHPIALMNVGFIIFLISSFAFLGFKSIDVLQDWKVELTDVQEYRVVNGERLAVYNPGDTLTFKSASIKLIDAKGTTTRMFVCEPNEKQAEREIQLDTVPATRPAGVNPYRENAITVPDVAQFDGLPRICNVIFDVAYTGIYGFRSHQEHAETVRFIVEEEELSASELKAMIEELREQIRSLESRSVGSTGITTTPAQPQPVISETPAPLSPVQETTPIFTAPTPQEEPSFFEQLLNTLPRLGGN